MRVGSRYHAQADLPPLPQEDLVTIIEEAG